VRNVPSLPLVLASGLFASAVVLVRAPSAPAGSEDRRPLDFPTVIETAKERVFPALVFLRPVQEDLTGGEKRRVEVFGSGVVVSPDGYVVTNHHVAENARHIQCVLQTRRRVEATVVGLDRETDLALLRLSLAPGERVPHADLARPGSLEEGQFVMALGAPYGFERSISLGIVSNARRHLGEADEHPWNNWIQTDAAINPGNSGGPLVDTRGAVVGINTLVHATGNNLGFAIPVDVVRRVAERLRRDGRVRRSRTGLTLRPLVDYLHNTVFPGDKGAIVDDVAPGSPAEAAGVRKGDRLLSVGRRETNAVYREDLPEIRWALADLPPGEPVPLLLERDARTVEVEIEADDDAAGEEAAFDASRWNATFRAIREDTVPELAFFRPRGAYVLGVRFPGNAAEAGLREGDVVLAVDRRPVDDLAGLRVAYEACLVSDRTKKVVLLEVLRAGRKKYLALDYARDRSVER
jgi:S1-C subfamily serine protease